MSFEKLLEELDTLQTLQKSEAADMDTDGAGDDAGIAEAAAEGEGDEGHPEPDGDEGLGGEGDGDGDEGGEGIAKSFSFTLENGEQVDAIDGTELVKSLIDRFDAQESTLAKAMGGVVELLKSNAETIRAQGDLIKSLQGEVKRIGGEGRGRKAVVSVAEKPVSDTLAKSEPDGMKPGEFMAKALSAQKANRISGLDVSIAETSLNRGMPIPPHIVSRVLG